jgi:beta-glucosidase
MCSVDATCAAYTWYQNSCYLKLAATGGTSAPGRVSGICKKQTSVTYTRGCATTECPDSNDFAAAAAAAAQADTVVLTLGLCGQLENEGLDRSDLNLPALQYQLLSTVRSAMPRPGQKLICVLIHGGVFALKNILQECDGILDLWSVGSQRAAMLATVTLHVRLMLTGCLEL